MVGTLRFAHPTAPSMTEAEFLNLAFQNSINKTIVDELFALAVPDAWLVSGCLVQTVWNVRTGRDVGYGIADYDVFYFDPDTSWEAEDAVIRRLAGRFATLGVAVEVRNQARVHLWYAQKHGMPYPPLHSAIEGIDRFLTKNTRIGIRRTREGYEVYAPDGFDDAENLVARPNMTREFLGGELCEEDGALEGVVAGGDGATVGPPLPTPDEPTLRPGLRRDDKFTAPRRK